MSHKGSKEGENRFWKKESQINHSEHCEATFTSACDCFLA